MASHSQRIALLESKFRAGRTPHNKKITTTNTLTTRKRQVFHRTNSKQVRRRLGRGEAMIIRGEAKSSEPKSGEAKSGDAGSSTENSGSDEGAFIDSDSMDTEIQSSPDPSPWKSSRHTARPLFGGGAGK